MRRLAWLFAALVGFAAFDAGAVPCPPGTTCYPANLVWIEALGKSLEQARTDGDLSGAGGMDLDLGADDVLESIGILELQTSGDINGVISESEDDVVLFDFSNAVPLADALAADPTNCSAGQTAGGVDASGNVEACLDPIEETELDDLAELEAQVATDLSIVLDLGDDDSNESELIVEIAITGNDANGIFDDPAAGKLLIDVGKNWPRADNLKSGAILEGLFPICFGGIVSDANETCLQIDEPGADGQIHIPNVGPGAFHFLVTPLRRDIDASAEDIFDVSALKLGASPNDVALRRNAADRLYHDTDDDATEDAGEGFVLQGDSIDVLADVDTTTATPSTGETLEWDGTNWVPGTDDVGGGLGADPANCSAGEGAGGVAQDGTAQDCTDYVEPTDSIDELADVDTTTSAPIVGEVLKWDGANWVPDTDSGGGSSIILDLLDDESNESTNLAEIAITNDVDGIASEPSADKLLLNLDPVLVKSMLPQTDSEPAGIAPADPKTEDFYVKFNADGELVSVAPLIPTGNTATYESLAAGETPVEGHMTVFDAVDNKVVVPPPMFPLFTGESGNPSWETASGSCWDLTTWSGAGFPSGASSCSGASATIRSGMNFTLRRFELYGQETATYNTSYGCFFMAMVNSVPVNRSLSGTATGGGTGQLIQTGQDFSPYVGEQVLIFNASDTASGSEMGWLRTIDSVSGVGNIEINWSPAVPEAVVSGDTYWIFPASTVCQFSGAPIDSTTNAVVSGTGGVCTISYAADVNGSTTGTPTGVQIKMVASSLSDGCASAGACICDAGDPEISWRVLGSLR